MIGLYGREEAFAGSMLSWATPTRIEWLDTAALKRTTLASLIAPRSRLSNAARISRR